MQAPTDAGGRGRLDIADRVIERLAVFAASEVSGVRTVGSALDRLAGRRLPKVDASVAGHRARISVQIAVEWPSPLPRVTAQVRDAVRERVSSLAGIQVDAVDVTAVKLVHPDDAVRQRVL